MQIRLFENFPDATLSEVVATIEDARMHARVLNTPGGREHPLTTALHVSFKNRGWQTITPLYHEIDLHRGRVAGEIQWNSKDTVLIRDLATFRLLWERSEIDSAFIITRCRKGWRTKNLASSHTNYENLLRMIAHGYLHRCPFAAIGLEVTDLSEGNSVDRQKRLF